MKLAKSAGKIIAEDYPDMADDYRNGTILRQIVAKYNIMEKYGIPSQLNAITAVRYALRNLISKEEMPKLASYHHMQHGKMHGHKMYKLGQGIHALTPEQKAEAGVKGGEVAYKRRLGIHASSAEQRTEARRKGALSRGCTLWSEGETTYFFTLCRNPEYNHDQGTNKGRPDYRKIAAELEVMFGNKRTTRDLYSYRFRHSKQN